MNNEFLHRRAAEVLERIEIQSHEQLDKLLRDRFGLELPATADVQFLFV